MCPGKARRRQEGAGSLLHIGHADARRVSCFLRSVHPDVANTLGDRDKSLPRNRVESWKKRGGRRAQLRAAIRVACTVDPETGKCRPPPSSSAAKSATRSSPAGGNASATP